MKEIVFLGSKPIAAACLTYLLEHQASLGIRIIAVGTQARKEFDQEAESVASIALANNIPILNSLDELPSCDIIYSVQYHKILTQAHIDKARLLAVNLHLAPLPEYRGCNQFSFAIMNEEKEFGVSIHKIDTRIDHGELLFERRFAIENDIWVEDLFNQSVAAGIILFQETIHPIVQGRYSVVDKKPNAVSHLYYRKDIDNLKCIDWNDAAALNYKKIRATMMPGFEPPYFILNQKKFYITKDY